MSKTHKAEVGITIVFGKAISGKDIAALVQYVADPDGSYVERNIDNGLVMIGQAPPDADCHLLVAPNDGNPSGFALNGDLVYDTITVSYHRWNGWASLRAIEGCPRIHAVCGFVFRFIDAYITSVQSGIFPLYERGPIEPSVVITSNNDDGDGRVEIFP